jgi:hypothetical protein
MIIGEAVKQPPFFMPTFEENNDSPMFNLFKKKKDSVKVIDRIWMSQAAKWKGLIELSKQDPSLLIVTWFGHTAEQLQAAFTEAGFASAPIQVARELHGALVKSHNVVFAEHYPVRTREQEVFLQWKLPQAIVHSSLDEPLFQQFGGDKIVEMMKKLGMEEDSMIQHALVSKSIENAQEKVEKKMTLEQPASSALEWMDRNMSR